MGATRWSTRPPSPPSTAWSRAGGGRPLVVLRGHRRARDHRRRPAGRRRTAPALVVVGVCMETDRINPFFGISKELNVQFCLGYDPMEFTEHAAGHRRGRDRRRPDDHRRGRPRRRRRRLRGPRQPRRALQDPGHPVSPTSPWTSTHAWRASASTEVGGSDELHREGGAGDGAARPRGIGRATALRLARGGADVACLDIARPYAEAPDARHRHGRRPRQRGRRDRGARPAGGRRASRRRPTRTRWRPPWPAATEALGTIQLVANVAGGSGMGFGVGPLLTVGADEFRKVLDVNVVGTWLVSKACRAADGRREGRWPHLQRVEPGRQEGLPDARRLLRRQVRRDPPHPVPGHASSARPASRSTPCAPAPSTPTSSTPTGCSS